MDIHSFLVSGALADEVEVSKPISKLEILGELDGEHNDYRYYYKKPFDICVDAHQIVISIAVDFTEPNVFVKEPRYRIRKHTSLFRVFAILARAGVKWAFNSRLTFDDQICIRTEGSVDMVFAKSKEGSITLSNVSKHILSN